MNITRHVAPILVACGLASTLVACGGGSAAPDPASSTGTGSTGGTVTVSGDGPVASFSVPSIKTTGATNAMQQVEFDVTVNGEPAGFTYPKATVTAGAAGFVAVDTVVTAQSNGRYHVVLVVDSTLAAATYTGNLSFDFCFDDRCTSSYWVSGGTLPYTVAMLPDPLVGVTVNGAAPSFDSAGMPKVHVGDTATLTTNVGTTWLTPDATAGYMIVTATPTSATVQFTANSMSTAPIVRYVTAGGSSQYWFQFSN